MEIIKTLEVIISILLIAVVLIQNKNVALNLSTMGGWMGEVVKRGPEKILHNATIALGIAFIVNSIALFLLS